MGLKNLDSKSVDLLMMTYGWRKYTLKESVLAYEEKREDNYDHLKIINPGQEKRGRTDIKFISPEGGNVITLSLNENRETLLPFDSLDAYARQIMVLPDDDPSRNSNPVSIKFPDNKVYTEDAKLIKTDSVYPNPQFISAEDEQPLFNQDSALMIEPVTIKGHKKKSTEYVAKSAQQFKYTGAYTLYSKDFLTAHTFEDILYKLNPYKIFTQYKRVILRTPINGLIGFPALFVVDGIQIHDRTYSPIASLPASEIASVTALRGSQGFSIYGNAARDGVIIVTTKSGNRINGIQMPEEEDGMEDNSFEPVRIFRTEVEFYIPNKEDVELNPEYRFSSTLLWSSDVFLDGSGPVKIKYPNNMGKGKVMLFVNGVSLTNQIGSGRGSYSIR
jgi:hypothetical protein